ncbi:hypothetical protein BO70DRAFT_310262 [Aspergillus heteromorphus CBS 117.55]|uniref:SprT-like domain-containing protein n=1 Tax=Aspergillus heteromorphus CBS 117.55 TaxID=1448321 RepID=A0A317WPV7_9EURO|nr:uncharacterized protein BO70DRAFT_310262 [Aspergillus heteromorphus CBS 117.55]PWY88469.1 hypothetical protein BO70DRAFT_310262 [Aspergillus heteromorphus CBS 117.55]
MARLNSASPTKPAVLRERLPATTTSSSNIGRSATVKRGLRDSTPMSQGKTDKEQWKLTDETSWSKSRSPTTTTTTTAAAAERPPQRINRLQRTGTVSSGTFNIFSESDGQSDTEESSRSSLSSTADRLKLTQVNSLLLPLPSPPRARPVRKSVGYNYDKENDPIDGEEQEDEGPSLSRNSSTASNQSPTRRVPPPHTGARGGPRTPNLGYLQQQQQPSSEDEQSEDENDDDDTNSLDDFIVSDNDEISYHESSADETSEEEDVGEEKQPTPSPPRTRKRLIRGRRLFTEAGPSTSPQGSPPNEGLRLDPALPGALTGAVPRLEAKPRRLFQRELDLSDRLGNLKLNQNSAESETDEVPRGQQSQNAGPVKETGPIMATPPGSPSRKNLLRSPKKTRVRIPPTPHQENTDLFWDQETTNAWVDKHSPRKPKNMNPLQELVDSDTEPMDQTNNRMSSRRAFSPIAIPETTPPSKPIPTKTPSKTAIKKLEAAQRKAEKARQQEWNENKDRLAREFFNVLDDAMTGGEISRLSAPTGGVHIIWHKPLQTTAGRAVWKGVVGEVPNIAHKVIRHHATIQLAPRVIDSEDRLIKTMAHEYCHLANFMISQEHKKFHGESFQRWARKCEAVMKPHPRYGNNQVTITNCHNYDINYKYEWKCDPCNKVIKRHSRSITKSHVCGNCHGPFRQVKPKPRKSPQKKKISPLETKKSLPLNAKGLLENVVEAMAADRDRDKARESTKCGLDDGGLGLAVVVTLSDTEDEGVVHV